MSPRKSRCKYQSSNRGQDANGANVRRFSLVLLALVSALFGIGTVRAETLKVSISLASLSPARLKIEGELLGGARAWSFRNIYANVMNLGERIENLSLTDASGARVAVRKLAPGEYEAASAATRFSYEIRLDAPAFETDAAHVSWLTDERGLLMLGDLLPLAANESGAATTTGAVVQLNFPQNWTIASSINAGAERRFEVADVEGAVFFVGQKLREKRERVGSLEFKFVTAGEWAFSDEDLAGMAADILKDHAATFGGFARGSVMLVLAPFPQPAGADHWSAETRGQTVMLLSGKLPSKTAALSQLTFPLAHELFHLWVPNGLALDGNYDWFYEGFTLYQALRAGIRLNLLTFQDYLNALGRAFDAYQMGRGREQLSLLDASKQRWTLQSALIYNKGMLVAFLYDMTLRQQTRGKRSLDEVYRELFRLYHAPESRRDGNAAVLSILNDAGGMQEFTRRYIEGASAIELPALIAPFGLQIEPGGVRTHISVSASLSGAQRDLLRKFGYNEKEYGVSGHRRVK